MKREKIKFVSHIRQNARIIAEERADWRKNFQKLLQAYQKMMEVR